MISAVDRLQILKTHRTSGQQTDEILLTEATYHCLALHSCVCSSKACLLEDGLFYLSCWLPTTCIYQFDNGFGIAGWAWNL